MRRPHGVCVPAGRACPDLTACGVVCGCTGCPPASFHTPADGPRVLLNNSASPGGRGGGGGLTRRNVTQGGSDTPPPSDIPPLPQVIGHIFLRVFSESKILSGAFDASQFRPKNFFSASNNSGCPEGGGSPHSPPPPYPPPPPPLRKTLDGPPPQTPDACRARPAPPSTCVISNT